MYLIEQLQQIDYVVISKISLMLKKSGEGELNLQNESMSSLTEINGLLYYGKK